MLFRMLRRRGTYPTRFGILFTRQSSAIGHPMDAVKEQSAILYATKMAEQGFVTLSGAKENSPKTKLHAFNPETLTNLQNTTLFWRPSYAQAIFSRCADLAMRPIKGPRPLRALASTRSPHFQGTY